MRTSYQGPRDYQPQYPPQGQYGQPPAPPRKSFASLVTVANKVRLGFAAGCQLLGLIVALCVPTTTAGQTLYISDGSSNGVRMEIWVALFLVTSAVLVGISVYRFVRPLPVPSSHDSVMWTGEES
jgi:hypothetical protein